MSAADVASRPLTDPARDSMALARIKRRRSKPAFTQVLQDLENRGGRTLRSTRSMCDFCRLKYHAYARWVARSLKPLFAGLQLAQLPDVDDVTGQSRVLVQEYIATRLRKQGLLGPAKSSLGGGDVSPTSCANLNSIPTVSTKEVSTEIQMIGNELEKMYPELYSNVAKQINVTFKSEALVRKTFTGVAEHLFRSGVTWGRVVALYSLAAGFATDCVHHGHPELVGVVIDTFTKIVSKYLASWIARQGGWGEIKRTFRTTKEAPVVWALSVTGALVGFVVTVIATVNL